MARAAYQFVELDDSESETLEWQARHNSLLNWTGSGLPDQKIIGIDRGGPYLCPDILFSLGWRPGGAMLDVWLLVVS